LISGCNEITDGGIWTGIIPNLTSLTILDCINIADETIAAICQMMPNLRVLQIQAYHVTDTAMSYFGPSCARDNLRVLMLQHCWELSNQGVVSLAHGLPSLCSLSLAGCSKVRSRIQNLDILFDHKLPHHKILCHKILYHKLLAYKSFPIKFFADKILNLEDLIPIK